MSEPDRWPKGPFPERYAFDRVLARTGASWSEPARAAWRSTVLAEHAIHPTFVDPHVLVFAAGPGAVPHCDGVLVCEWTPPWKGRAAVESVWRAALPTADLVDAISLVGTCGPHHGIGLAAVVRFVVTLRAMAGLELVRIGEDHLELALALRDARDADRIATRIPDLCPPLRDVAASERKRTIMEGRLVLSWPSR